jgi:hypothetical protein
MHRFLYSKMASGALLFLGALLVYVNTMSSGIGTEDPGELAAVLHTMGIAHPTGYPLYTMLGSLFVRIPIGDYGAWRMNLFGALLTALAVYQFWGLFRFIFSNRGRTAFSSSTRAQGSTEFQRGPLSDECAALAAPLIFAFSAVFWQQGVFLEVYALHLVFLAVVTRLFLTSLVEEGQQKGRRTWLLFAYVLGLSFAHHMMTSLLAPAFLWLFFRVQGFNRRAFMLIAYAIPPFVLGLTAYLFILIRSATAPLMNWGEPNNWGALWKHVRGAQYGEQMFSSWEIAVRKLTQFAVDLPVDFGWPVIVLAIAGIVVLYRTLPGLLIFSGLVFGTGLVYAANYAFDDPNFHLHPHFMVALWAGAALGGLWTVKAGKLTLAVRLICALLALSPLLLNFKTMDKSRDTLVSDYSRNVLESLDSGAVLFTNEYERLGSPAFYWQIVQGYRSDAVVLDIILLGNPWFFSHLEARHPWLMKASRAEIAVYREELHRFVHGPRDTVAYNARLRAMFRSIIENSRRANRPVYFTSGINADEAPGYRLVPSGMVFRLEPDSNTTAYIPPRDFTLAPLPSPSVNRLSEQIRVEYAEGYANQGAHVLEHRDTVRAAERFRKALAMYPNFPAVRELLNSIAPMR